MEPKDIILATYNGQIEAYQKIYSYKNIQSASENELWKLIYGMKSKIEEHKIVQHQLSEYVNKPDVYWDKSEILIFQHKKQLQAVNEIILHLETMLQFAEIERRKYDNQLLKELVTDISKTFDKFNKVIDSAKKNEAVVQEPISWNKTKSEFCQFIRGEYKQHQDQYLSLKDATIKLFNQHKFPFKWTASSCYELVKKIQ